MKRIGRQISIVIVVLVGVSFLPAMSSAETRDPKLIKCPACGKWFGDVVTMSYSIREMDVEADLKPDYSRSDYGGPEALTCPYCLYSGFYWRDFHDVLALPAETGSKFKSTKAIVLPNGIEPGQIEESWSANEFLRFLKKENRKYPVELTNTDILYRANYPDYVKFDFMAQTYTLLNRPADDIAEAYLLASWEAEGETKKQYQRLVIQYYEKALEQGLVKDASTIQYLLGELNRRLGIVTKARYYFALADKANDLPGHIRELLVLQQNLLPPKD